MLPVVRLFSAIFTNTYSFLSRLFLGRTCKVVFISFPDFSDNAFYVYQRMLQRGIKAKYIWLVTQSFENENRVLTGSLFVKKNSIRGIYHFLTATVVFHTHGCFSFLRGAKSPFQVGLWHGMPIKNIGRLNQGQQPPFSHVTISTSDYFSSILSKSFEIDLSDIWVTGLPRNDSLASRPHEKDIINIRNRLGVFEQEKIIFWLPTFRVSRSGVGWVDSTSESFLSEWGESFFESLDEVLIKNKIKLIIKLHPLDALNDALPCWGFENINFIPADEWHDLELDLYQCLSISSGLISDVSSVIVDYLVTKKPIAITSSSLKSYSRECIEKIDYLFEACFSIDSEEDFLEFISSADHFVPNESVVSVFYNDVAALPGASDRVIDNVVDRVKCLG